MEQTKLYLRRIITTLLAIQDKDLYISGQALLTSLSFNQHFLYVRDLTHRPTFLLKPDGKNQKLVLTLDNIWEENMLPGRTGNYAKHSLSRDKKSVLFLNSVPLMYIFEPCDFTDEELRFILAGTAFYNGISKGDQAGEELAKKVVDLGLMQPSVKHISFLFRTDHEDSKAGRFTLCIR